ncbi:MAG TPA: DUF4390 domain-containing protein [Gemmatimonadaceae bacterium]|nr:DUF4390 domain-containing protein [Gemmatimonadaceae bacterium]
MRPLGAAIVLVFALAFDARAQQAARRDQPVPASPAAVQLAAGIDVSVPASTPTTPVPMGPVIRTANVIADRELQTLLQNGFPANLHYRTELWARGGLFDDVKSSVEWDVLVRYEPLTKTYRVARFVGQDAENLGRFERYEDAQAALARPYQPKLPARRTRDRQYYIVTLEVEVLSMSDLDEIDRWLRGELRPAVRGKRNPGTALGRGLSRLATRLLGGENRRYEQRSPMFRVGRE